MAKTKAYTVRRAFASRRKDSGEEVWVTRENEHQILDLLTAARIRECVASGALEESEIEVPETEVPEIEVPEIEVPKTKVSHRAKE